ncbi:MAG: hypothetical protein QGE99_05435 [SAR202 cluster bacterium]|jgi:hypothetical protein|nr:hypothetical protein [SAR202 cluster bacterium]|tara:strand:- start:390 stop:686 length:297 start_codon:yes stop_codon:yes gene_type:complete
MSSDLSRSEPTRYKKYLRLEIEAASTYKILARFETDPEKSEIFDQLSQSELKHARHWSIKLGNPIADVTLHTYTQKLLYTGGLLPIRSTKNIALAGKN